MAGGGFCDRHIIRGHRNCHRMRTLRYCAVVMGTLSSPLLLSLTPSSFLLSHYHHHYCCLSRHHHLYCLPFIIIFIASLSSSFLLPPFYHHFYCLPFIIIFIASLSSSSLLFFLTEKTSQALLGERGGETGDEPVSEGARKYYCCYL